MVRACTDFQRPVATSAKMERATDSAVPFPLWQVSLGMPMAVYIAKIQGGVLDNFLLGVVILVNLTFVGYLVYICTESLLRGRCSALRKKAQKLSLG